ncbi:unnamed protein product [Nippostrongylus brasiliensis]|uniref:Uncharacterized protein n=1 Tax=Nippostrongylus brasiliensis TaxID=27835 RepID=A0A0N4XWW4_NIPBR|nr:unnamed protein product [Nippostrongylus brasiliensis]
MRSHRRVASGAEGSEDGVNVERLQAEVRRLKRLVQDKDLVIDTLMERTKIFFIVFYGCCNGRTADVFYCCVAKGFGTVSNIYYSQGLEGSNPQEEEQFVAVDSAFDFNPMNTSTSSHAFVVPKPFGDLDVNKNRKVCLQSKRPEIIRRIENRQAAISAATALRHRVSEEKRIAARAVVLGKCPFSKVRNNLFRDPTVITAFPKHEIINLTKRRLRESSAYRSEKSGEKNRIDIAASKIIAQSFSEATRQAVLAGRTSFNQ